MASERFDRAIIQVQPTEDIKLLVRRLNEKLRYISEQIYKLEGRSGETTTKNSLTVKSDGYTLLDLEGQLAGKAAFSATSGTSRTFEIAKGARRESDGQWVATDTGAIILQMKDDGTMVMYADTGLTVGAAFAPTVAITFPSGTGIHGLVSATHTVAGLTAGHVLTATATNAFGFAANAALVMPSCHVHFADDQSIANSTETDLLFSGTSSEDHDNASMHSTSSNTDRITIPSTGVYCFGAHVLWLTSAVGTRMLTITLNDPAAAAAAAKIVEVQKDPAVSTYCWESVVATRMLAAGDVLRVNVWHSAGVALAIGGTDTYGPRSNGFWCFKVSD